MPYTFETHNTDPSINAFNTYLQGSITVPRHKLVEVFGEPMVNGYEDKICCEWMIEVTTDDGTLCVITIYDWKNYSNAAMDANYSDWNVGGHSGLFHTDIIMDIIEAHNETDKKPPHNVMVIVPQSDLDAVEVARIKLHEMFSDIDTNTLIKIAAITEPMWKVANKKYKIVDK